MIRGTVIGQVWGTRKARGLDGQTLLLVAARDAEGRPTGRVVVASRHARRARGRGRDGGVRLGRAQRAASRRRKIATCCATRRSPRSWKERADVSRTRRGNGLVDGEVAAGQGAQAAAGAAVSPRRSAARRRGRRRRGGVGADRRSGGLRGHAGRGSRRRRASSPSATRRASRSARSCRPGASRSSRSTPPSSRSSTAWRSTVKGTDDRPAPPRRRGDARGGRRRPPGARAGRDVARGRGAPRRRGGAGRARRHDDREEPARHRRQDRAGDRRRGRGHRRHLADAGLGLLHDDHHRRHRRAVGVVRRVQDAARRGGRRRWAPSAWSCTKTS